MAKEIERKFLVKQDLWQPGERHKLYKQGYLSLDPERNVRVRSNGERAFLTIKGKTRGATRSEFEYEIPPGDAEQMLDTLCHQPVIEKTRYEIEYAGFVWEVDVFHGDNAGLILAEIELEHETQTVKLPEWAGQEVTGDPRYYNAYLAQHPYRSWP